MTTIINESNNNASNSQYSESVSEDANPYGDEYHEANVIDEKVPQVRSKVKIGKMSSIKRFWMAEVPKPSLLVPEFQPI